MLSKLWKRQAPQMVGVDIGSHEVKAILLSKTADGYKVTEQEGFVAIDKVGKAVKLVDRMNFSKANFSTDYIKGWQK
jgi:Tfp pilus assembly PilM family ATPase